MKLLKFYLALALAISTTTVRAANTARFENGVFSGALTLSGLSTGVVHSSSVGLLTSSLIVNADISGAAAVDRSKLASGTANRIVHNSGAGAVTETAGFVFNGTSMGINQVSPNIRSFGRALTINAASGGDVALELGVNGASTGEIFADASRVVVSAYANLPLDFRTNNTRRGGFSASGAFDLTAPTASRAAIFNSSKELTHSSTTDTQLAYLSSATGTTGTTSTNLVFSTSPTLVTPNLGTPSTLVGTNITGTAAGLTAGTATALAADPTDCSAGQKATGIAASGNLTCSAVSLTADVSGTLPVANGGTGVTSSTGTGAVMLGTSPSVTTSILPATNWDGTSGVDLGSSSFVWKDLYLGHQLVYTGVQPTSVATATGTAADGPISFTATRGGDTTIATTGTGGSGAGWAYTGGAGGVASSAATASSGGPSQSILVISGAGGAAAVAGTGTNTGGNSGLNELRGGVGGAATGATSGTNTGGSGGQAGLRGGAGGAASGGSGTHAGGTGGSILLQPATGGAATGGTTATAGNGGSMNLNTNAARGGNASGASGTNTGGNGPGFNVNTGGAAGGTASGGTTNIGGVGGVINILSGAGGATSGSGTTNTSGAGGAYTLTTGAGGATTGTGTTNTAGAAGAFSIVGGVGGAASGAGTTNNAGAGASVAITAGAGGDSSGGSTNNGGNGGSVQIAAGAAGTGSTANGTAGAILLQTAGSSRQIVQRDGTIRLVQVTASTVPVNASGEGGHYMVGSKYVLWYNDAGTMRYKYLDMSGTGVTWVHTTTAP